MRIKDHRERVDKLQKWIVSCIRDSIRSGDIVHIVTPLPGWVLFSDLERILSGYNPTIGWDEQEGYHISGVTSFGEPWAITAR